MIDLRHSKDIRKIVSYFIQILSKCTSFEEFKLYVPLLRFYLPVYAGCWDIPSDLSLVIAVVWGTRLTLQRLMKIVDEFDVDKILFKKSLKLSAYLEFYQNIDGIGYSFIS